MKTRNLFLSLLAVAAFTSCSNEDTPQVPETRDGRFIAVNINNTVDASRAAGASYENGLAAENNVSSVTFLFFDASGNPYVVDGTNNYVVKAPEASGSTSEPNVEKILNAVLVIEASKQAPPASILAVLNADDDLTSAIVNKSLTALKDVTSAFKATDFFMSNSVYVNSVGEEVTAVKLQPENICTTEAAALATPVEIYVERLAAKVRVGYKEGVDKNLIPVMTDATPSEQMKDSKGNAIYAKILGWDVTNTLSSMYTIKNINTDWTDVNLGFTWNDAPYFRSYWAETKSSLDSKHTLTWTALESHTEAYDYYFENTLASTIEKNGVDAISESGNNYSQLLVAAEFVDADGNPLSIAEWYGVMYTLDDLKTAIAGSLASKLYVVETKDAEGNVLTATSITASDLDFEQESMTATDNRYLSYVKLSATGAAKEYCDVNKNKYTDADAVNTYLKTLNPALIWKEGGYYFFNIKHLGTTGKTGEFGIVRNHIYDITVDGVIGLGTPVYDPTHIITPEIPNIDQATYVSARINILSWRVVTNTVILQ